ncbi:hypothetical protein MAM1_0047d03200 [Mucor ambiguus]|uniref:Uncharacterized protein n=1 Tax=Mucor ambiguus TaxID=91626 RepID=A0A0C9LTH5_9FUNG|nr:hypothetical protein MAM1_0047d03200 [Mucor ambiguus]
MMSTSQNDRWRLWLWLWWEPTTEVTTSSPFAYELIKETSTINYKRAYSVTMATSVSTSAAAAAAAAAVEIKSEFPPLTRIQIILIALLSSAVLLFLLCTIVYLIYKRIKTKQQQKMAESERHDKMAVGGLHRSTRPIIYNICTDINSTAFLNPSASTTFTVSSSQSTSRFQEYFPA